MNSAGPRAEETVAYASCVAVDENAALILGPSGAGKSRLALELIALGATLVSDDRVVLRREGGTLRAAPPKPLEGLIEARGVGLLATKWSAGAAVRLIADLSEMEPERLPPRRTLEMLGVTLPVVLCKDLPGAGPALFVLLRSGGARRAP